MTWIALGLLSHLSWALVNIGDKYLVGNRIKYPIVYMFFLFWIGSIAVFLIPFVDFFLPTNHELLLLFGAGIFWKLGAFPYIKAMQIEEATRLNVWWSFIAIWSLILGVVFFGERLGLIEILGFVILISTSIVASIHADKRKFYFSRAVLYMILGCFFFASSAVLMHEVAKSVTAVNTFIWVTILPLPFTLLLFFSRRFRHDFREQVRLLTPNTFLVMLGIRLFDSIGYFFSISALSFASAALVYSLEGSQALFVFGMVALISIFAPKVMKEKFDTKNVLLKLFAIVLMAIGITILALG